ncbi:hypothetical protein HF521_004905 [Silurus meridionalis]|uniref:Ig-like domain-containing protein n=1 Tax=Silurus meridionalis TaxID=175797 RepID=A0A8T0AY22_SILME|nr:hypothetical protein HF521_004905 [Silurus meridionalis]
MFSTSLLLLLAAASYVHGVELTQPASMTVQPGQSLSINCKVSYSVTSYATAWIRQPAGKPLVWTGRVWSGGNGNNYANSFTGRIEITRDNSNSMVYLKLSGVTAEDTAVYYCSRSTVAEI